MTKAQQAQMLRDAYLRGELPYADYVTQFSALTQGAGMDELVDLEMFNPQRVVAEQQAKQQARSQGRYENATGLLDIARQLGLTALVGEQIASSNRGLAQPAPGQPTAPGPDPALQQRLYEAQRRASDLSPVLDPAKQQIENAYLSGLQQAQAASGGQAGNLQSQAQLLNLMRMQQGLQLAPMAQQARLQNEGVVGDYMGMRQNERQAMFANQMAANQVLQERYNNAQQAYGQAGAYGRFNLANILQNFRLPEYFNWLPVDDETSSVMKKTEERYAAGNAINDYLRHDFGPQFKSEKASFKGY